MPTVEDFSIFTTLRWDPLLEKTHGDALYMLEAHRDRLLNAVKYFNSSGSPEQGLGAWGRTIDLLENWTQFERNVEHGLKVQHLEQPLRVRITLPVPQGPKDKLIKISTFPTPPVHIETLFPTTLPSPPSPSSTPLDWTLILDTEPTKPSPLTSYKTSSRKHYEISRSRCGLPPQGSPHSHKEVILYSPEGEIMEGSITNLYFFRDGVWITPPLSSGGCEGTVRRWLLERKLVQESIVRKEDVKEGEWVLMSNGVRGVFGGRVVSSEEQAPNASS